MPPVGSSPYWAAAVALIDAIIALLTAFHVGPTITPEQRTAVLGLLAAGFVVASLAVAYFQHKNAQVLATLTAQYHLQAGAGHVPGASGAAPPLIR